MYVLHVCLDVCIELYGMFVLHVCMGYLFLYLEVRFPFDLVLILYLCIVWHVCITCMYGMFVLHVCMAYLFLYLEVRFPFDLGPADLDLSNRFG